MFQGVLVVGLMARLLSIGVLASCCRLSCTAAHHLPSAVPPNTTRAGPSAHLNACTYLCADISNIYINIDINHKLNYNIDNDNDQSDNKSNNDKDKDNDEKDKENEDNNKEDK